MLVKNLIKKLNEDFTFKEKEEGYKCKTKILKKVLLIPKHARKGVNIVVNNIDRVVIETDSLDPELAIVSFYNRKDDSFTAVNLKNMRNIEFQAYEQGVMHVR